MVAGPTVLVVDDNEANRALARATLEDQGYVVVLAEDGEAGIAAFERVAPDCVLLDIQMPGMSGVSACVKIRTLPGGADVPIVFVTAQHAPATLDRALLAGGDDFLTKPFRPTELVVRVHAAMRLRTLIRERNEQRERAQKLADEASATRIRIEESRERFIGILGHDLRNPLAAILMGVEMLGELPAPHAGVVARVGRSALRIEAMIRDVLDFARGRLGDGIPVAKAHVDMRGICEEIVAEMTQAYPARNICFEGAGDLRGEWDPARVQQVLSNLVGNAVTHGADAVRVTGSDDGDAVVVTVHNHGATIPAAAIKTLFEPFTTAGQASKPGGGLGLGLYIASEIVRAHGGTISVASDHRAGTTFAIRWPRQASPRVAATHPG